MIRRFSFDLHMRRSCSARCLVKGTSKSVRKRSVFGFERFQPFEQITGRDVAGAPAAGWLSSPFGQRGWKASRAGTAAQ